MSWSRRRRLRRHPAALRRDWTRRFCWPRKGTQAPSRFWIETGCWQDSKQQRLWRSDRRLKMSQPPKTLPDGSQAIGDLESVIDSARARIRAWPALARERLGSLRRLLAMREENLFLVLAVVIGLFSGLLV